MVDVLQMLNHTVNDSMLFNSVVEYQKQMRKSMLENLENLEEKVFTLNKRKVSEMEIPSKRKIIVNLE